VPTATGKFLGIAVPKLPPSMLKCQQCKQEPRRKCLDPQCPYRKVAK
jgi:hypothetical protein